ncbi:hypothetical protein [uncultured Desulfobacter sp.]|uniref:hypothetical protein n=1 Tax=uncultured Desulfobacter sp. TaxID=240139 RepID=UPI0029F5C8E0|nr:hypothetical protein [uncultured Desulfobacter sp.]
MKNDLLNAFNCRDKRALGVSSQLDINKHIRNRLYGDDYVLFIGNDLSVGSIFQTLYDDELIDMIDESFLYQKSSDYTSDIIFLINILLDSFNVYKNQHVNSRLKYFSLRLFLNLADYKGSSDEYIKLKNFVFSKLLYCHPTDSDFQSLFIFKKYSNSNNSTLFYRGFKIDLIEIFNSYIEGVLSSPRIIEKLLKKHITQEIIKNIRIFVCDLLEVLNNKSSHFYIKIELNGGELNDIFTNQYSLFDVFEKKKSFYQLLKFSLKNYTIMSWEDKNFNLASLFYGFNSDKGIGKESVRPQFSSVSEKYLSEYFIDSCIALFFRDVNNMKEIVSNIEDRDTKKILSILFSHPFYDFEARKILSKEKHLVSKLSNGFWIDKMKFMKKQWLCGSGSCNDL